MSILKYQHAAKLEPDTFLKLMTAFPTLTTNEINDLFLDLQNTKIDFIQPVNPLFA